MKAKMSTATIVEPTGVPARIETSIPSEAQVTDKHAEQIVTDLKLLKTRIEDNAGTLRRHPPVSQNRFFIPRSGFHAQKGCGRNEF